MHAESHGPRIVIAINDSQTRLNVDPADLRTLVRNVLAGEGIAEADLSIALVDDATIHSLNRLHLNHDWPTDVITFSLGDSGDSAIEAELIVSTEMAWRTAQEAGADPSAELALYVVHGLLHLCGFDDVRPEDAARMRKREEEVLAREGIVNTFSLVDERPEARREGPSCSA
jgi:probable rRNA maturation factor